MLYQHQFPIHSEIFPYISQSQLITNAFMEAKTITQAPDAMVYMTAISSVSLALQGLINVEIPTGKISPVSLMALTVAESGERKSSVENLFTKGIKSFQKVDVEKYKAQFEGYKIKLELHEKKTAQIKKSVDLDNKEQCDEMVSVLLAHQENMPAKPMLSLLTFEDSTIEALLSGLSENVPNAFLGFSEGGVLLNSRAMSQTASFNAIWSGDDVTVNRKTAESFTLENARLTVHIMTQWSALDRFMKKSKDDVRGNGFLSRFLVCAPPSKCGFRPSNGVNYSRDGLLAFNDRLSELLSESAAFSDYTDRKTVRFSNEAKKIWLDVYNDIEMKMAPNGMYQYVKDHASKLPENIARLAALIHCFDMPFDEEISATTLLESINLVSYFSAQFMKIFCAPPKHVIDADNLMRWFSSYINTGVRYVKRNDILQFGPSGTRKKRDLDSALDYLKLSNSLIEIRANKTVVIDLWPSYVPDASKLKQDLSLGIVF